MTDPAAKIKAIERELLDAKRAAFERIKRESPDAAAFLAMAAEMFGKPSAVEIEFADGTKFVTGDWK